jgi:Flp pilus assembly protein TadG
MAIRPLRSRWQSERGAELIEFALVTPILILLLSGIFDFGMMFRTLEAVTNAAREGARVGVLPGYEDAADVQSRVNAYLAASGLSNATSVDSPFVPVVTSAGTFTARSVTVNYTYQFAILGAVGTAFGSSFGSFPLQAVSVMRTETAAAP